MLIAVTGAGGYLGGKLLSHLRATNMPAIAFSRQARLGDAPTRRYSFGEPIEDGALEHVTAVVHCAYDMKDRSPQGSNVRGSLPLLDAAAREGVRVVLVSSLSAYRGCRSQYGQSKLALEDLVYERGGAVVRPGLIVGSPPGGLFKSLVSATSQRRIIPMIGGGHQRLYISQDEALCALLVDMATGAAQVGLKRPVFAAHATSSTLHEIVSELRAGSAREVLEVPVPWRGVHGALLAAEALGIDLGFASDSVVALAHPIPLDQLGELDASTVQFPRFTSDLLH
jgi:nucleoside-diphosphate-sugar epimerase